jgi:hypothetical protein
LRLRNNLSRRQTRQINHLRPLQFSSLRKTDNLARKSAGLPLPELQASLMLLASDALSKFDGSTAPPSPAPTQQQPPVEAHPPPAPPSATQARETAPPVVPSQPAAAAVAPVTPVAEPRAKETPPQGGSTQGEEEETEGLQAVATATTNLNSAKAEAKLVKALDYLVAINDHSNNPGREVVHQRIHSCLPRRLF